MTMAWLMSVAVFSVELSSHSFNILNIVIQAEHSTIQVHSYKENIFVDHARQWEYMVRYEFCSTFCTVTTFQGLNKNFLLPDIRLFQSAAEDMTKKAISQEKED